MRKQEIREWVIFGNDDGEKLAFAGGYTITYSIFDAKRYLSIADANIEQRNDALLRDVVKRHNLRPLQIRAMAKIDTWDWDK